jgi:hypothetical protein
MPLGVGLWNPGIDQGSGETARERSNQGSAQEPARGDDWPDARQSERAKAQDCAGCGTGRATHTCRSGAIVIPALLAPNQSDAFGRKAVSRETNDNVPRILEAAIVASDHLSHGVIPYRLAQRSA